MKFKIKRDGARLEVTNDGVAQFRGVLAKEVLNPTRYVSIMPPSADLKLIPGSLYAVYTGLEVNRLSFSTAAVMGLDVRPVSAVFKDCGMRVERVDIDGAMKDGELVVYVSVNREFNLNRNEELFESFRFGQSNPTITVAEEQASSTGFVPVAAKSITEAPKKNTGAPRQETEQTDEQRRKALDAWLNTPDTTPTQQITAGQPAGALTDVPLDSNGKPLPRGTVKAATPEGV